MRLRTLVSMATAIGLLLGLAVGCGQYNMRPGPEALAAADQVHCVGRRMKALHKALPAGRRGRWRESSDQLAADLPGLLDAGDVVMIKGSLGARMARVVAGVKGLGEAEPVAAEPADEAN